MDRFVTRTPSWKTLNYNTVVAQSTNKRPVPLKTTTAQPLGSEKKPLQQKQITQDFSRRISEILRPVRSSSPSPAIENYNGSSNDSGLSSASSISPPTTSVDNGEPSCPAISSPMKKYQTPTKNYLGKLGDYVDCPEEKENDTCMTIARTPKSSKKSPESNELKENNTPSKQLPQTPKATKQHMQTVSSTLTAENQRTPSRNPMLMSRIQRDLNSPSASVRVRALKAIASPTKSPYTHFDIPEAEQSLNFSNPQDSRDIKDVMRNVIVYVEVRSGEDNRSEGVRKVIEALGARVNLKLNKDTTHVVFKEGRQSTFKKAQQCGIPIVSILWIEACKKQNRICDPKDFPISNLDRYENPELYSKMKIFRHMQPGSECNKRKVKTPSTTKDTTPTQTTGTSKKNSTLIGTTPTSSSSNHKKTDISQFFKKLDKTNKVLTTPKSTATTAAGDTSKASLESPATQLLNSITSELYTKDAKTKGKIDFQFEEESREPTCNLNKSNKVKKALDFFQSKREFGSRTIIKRTPCTNSRQSTTAAAAAAITDNKESTELCTRSKTPKVQTRRSTLPPEDANDMCTSVTPTRSTRRRSSIHTPKNMSIETPKRDIQFEIITEEVPVVDAVAENSEIPCKVSQTLYSTKLIADNSEVVTSLNTELNPPTALSKSGRRRTIYSYKTMNESGLKAAINASNVTKRRPTSYSIESIKTDTVTSDSKGDPDCTTAKEDTEKIESEKYADLTNNIINSLSNKDESSKSETSKKPTTAVASIRRKTLYTPKKSNADTIKRLTTVLTPSVSDGLCITPTARNMQGKVAACSTLLERAESPEKLMETPPATSGKLLEETKECATPYLFSSSRQPGNKRRSLFDVSMDIITQRLQCINQSARRSLIPSVAADNINNNTNIKSLDTPPPATAGNKKITILPETDTENSTPSNSSISVNNNITTPDCCASAILKKKRKLFIPNETLTPPPILGSVATNKLATPSAANRRASLSSSAIKTLTTPSITTSSQKSVTKRRRTLVPYSQPTFSVPTANLSVLGPTEESSTPFSPLRKRRSTLDFEQIQKAQNKMAHNGAKSTYGTTTPTVHGEVAKTEVKSKNLPVLVYTNMHKEQIDVIREVVEKLGNCNLEQTVSDSTTHLVSLEPRRTMNLLRALVRGLWIVEYSWVLDSMKAGELLPEEPYELQGFSRAVEICRSERQAFGNIYKCEIFRDLGPFYISLRCYPVRRNDLIELITLCGGRLSQNRNKARYIIGDPNTVLDEKVYITPYWVLDSISQMQILKYQKYLYPKPFERPEPTSLVEKL